MAHRRTNRKTNLRSRFFKLLICAAFAPIVGCGASNDIQLTGPGLPTAPPPSESSPKGPGQPSNNSSNGASDDPSSDGPKPPTTSGPLYRIACEDSMGLSNVGTISSLASPTGLGARLDNMEVGPGGKPEAGSTKNLDRLKFPTIVSLPQFGRIRYLFSALRFKIYGSSDPQRRVYMADGDISLKKGDAVVVGDEIAADPSFTMIERSEGVSVATFGVSDRGSYLLLGTAQGYRLLDPVSFRDRGFVKTGSAAMNASPTLREADMVFTVSTLTGRGGAARDVDGRNAVFKTMVYALEKDSRSGLYSSKYLGEVSNLRRPLMSVSWQGGESFASVDSSNRLRVVSLGSSRLKLVETSVEIANLPKEGSLSSATTFWRDSGSGQLRSAIAFENIVRDGYDSYGSQRYKIIQVFVRLVHVDESKLLAQPMSSDFDYPPEVRHTIETSLQSSRYPRIGELRVAPDGKALFALFPWDSDSGVFRWSSVGFERVSTLACHGLSIGVEK